MIASALQNRARSPAAELSHGERRQLEIAIALALGSKAFLLDEPMAGMGQEGSRALTSLLEGCAREAPILLVEHDMDAVFALADRISVLVYGAHHRQRQRRRDPQRSRGAPRLSGSGRMTLLQVAAIEDLLRREPSVVRGQHPSLDILKIGSDEFESAFFSAVMSTRLREIRPSEANIGVLSFWPCLLSL